MVKDGRKVIGGLAIVAGIIGLIYAATREVEAAPPPAPPVPPVPPIPPDVIVVSIKNPLVVGDHWDMFLAPAAFIPGISVNRVPIDEPGIFENLPFDTWRIYGYDNPWPLRFTFQIFDENRVELLYLNSFSPQWQPYTDASIPSFGNYCLDLATGQFERIE